MNDDRLTFQERITLLKIARQALECSVRAQALPSINYDKLSPLLCAPGASFVTLTIFGRLRGCIGTLEPFRPLAHDVQDRTVSAAFNDYRFSNVNSDELNDIQIEISRLTQPQPLFYSNPEELCSRLRPGIDGVVLHDGSRRATFLPQVWSSLPLPEDFLRALCQKMGAHDDLWRCKVLDIEIYQVEEFHE